MQNIQVQLAKKPGPSYPEVNDIFQVKQVSTPNADSLKEGEVLIETLYLSIDAAMRVWVSGVKTYFDPVHPGDVMPGGGVGRVLHSKSQSFKVGDIVSGLLLWQQVLVRNEKLIKKVAQGDIDELSAVSFLGPFGISGLTAYTGLEHIGKPQPGETVLISAAAGAVGELAVQIAKNHYKCRVIGIAGGKEKCDYVIKELGADACIDYKVQDVEKCLRELCPQGIDIYFDNVGGEQLDAALMNITMNSRIILCGAISQYNKQRKDLYKLKNYPRLIIKKALMQGYIYTDYAKSFTAGITTMKELTSKGQLKVRYDFQNGLQQAPSGLQKLLLGKNEGKVIVRVRGQNIQPKL